MKIVGIDLFPIRLTPIKRDYQAHHAGGLPVAATVIVRVNTDQGLCGLGGGDRRHGILQSDAGRTRRLVARLCDGARWRESVGPDRRSSHHGSRSPVNFRRVASPPGPASTSRSTTSPARREAARSTSCSAARNGRASIC